MNGITLTKQEIFDRAYTAMIQQGRPSLNATGGACLYRGIDGLKCAVGALINDDEYSIEMEYHDIDTMPHGLIPDRLLPHVDFLTEIQEAHDIAGGVFADRFVEDFRERMQEIAVAYNLAVPEVKW